MKFSNYAFASTCGLLAVVIHPTTAFAKLSTSSVVDVHAVASSLSSSSSALYADLIPPTPIAIGEAASAFETYVQKTYGRYPLTITRGQGCMLYDEDDKSYLDFVAGIGALVYTYTWKLIDWFLDGSIIYLPHFPYYTHIEDIFLFVFCC